MSNLPSRVKSIFKSILESIKEMVVLASSRRHFGFLTKALWRGYLVISSVLVPPVKTYKTFVSEFYF